ncbi:MAG: PAS domain S-box protein [Acidobacteria bacterium]|nr:PAS domain S-box protein [Acidobacteriota bacterium]MBV9477671.1 PAS domain S-box protein [Acidobacteriota bacterium]
MPLNQELLQDEGRIAALRRYDILGARSDPAFDDLTRLAAQICSTPAAGIALVDVDRQLFLSEIGIGIREVPLDRAISIFALAEEDALVVPDLAEHEVFASRRDPRFRYLAAVPLRTPDGYAIGALTVIDVVPRLLSHQQLDALRALARQVMTQLELRRTLAERERSAAALRESEERFRAAFEHAVVGMVLTGGDGRVLRANLAFQAIVGRTADELIGRDSYDYTYPDDRNANVEWIRSVDTEEISHATFEKRYVRKNGEVVWARVHLSPVRDASGDARTLLALVEDVTEQRRTRDALVETRRRLDSALIAGEVATYEWKVDSDRLWGDANFDRFFGVARDADGTAPLARFVEAIHPDDHALVQQKIARTLETGEEYEAEYRIANTAVERWVIARGRVTSDPSDGTRRFHGVVLDITARKQLEQELARRTNIYESILSATDDFAYLFALDGTFLFANRRLLEVWGKTLPEIVGASLYDLGYQDWHAQMHLRELREVIEEKHAITGEVPYMAPTGIFGVYEYIFTPVFNEQGEVEVIAGTTRDVTERKRAEEEHRKLAEQLRLALDAAKMGWWQYDLKTGRVTWDDRVRELYGVDANVQDYDAVLHHMHPDDAKMVDAALAAATDPRDPRPYDVEYRLLLPDGGVRWIASKGQATFEGEGEERHVALFVGTALDVTEAKNAQAALEASEARFRRLADAMPQLVWTADGDGAIDYFNRPFLEYTGMSAATADADFWKDVLHPDDFPAMAKAWRESVRTGAPFETEFRMRRHSDGAYRWFFARALSVRDSATGEVRWFGTSTDVDDQRRLLEENQRLLGSERTARADAERASRMKDEFLATLSHELRTPLSAILGWSQILASGDTSPEELTEGIAVIRRNARVQAQIIEDLLEMSRIISGKIRLDIEEELDVRDVIFAAIDTVRPAANAKGVEIVTSMDEGSQRITGDPNRLQQVFWNLLSNAVKFTPKEGRIDVRLHDRTSHVEVEVADTGEGISPDFLPYVFDRFRQADAGTTRRHGGLGLGLAIVKQLVELHGGWVRASSGGAGRGATFSVTLPLVAAKQNDDDLQRERKPESRRTTLGGDLSDAIGGLRVLVVDDEPDARDVVRRVLADCGVAVTTAASAEEAIAQLEQQAFDVLVSDIGMPGEDGYSMIRRIRERWPSLPAVALSAYARPEDREKAMRAGYQMHIAKPAEPVQVIAAVASLADRA